MTKPAMNTPTELDILRFCIDMLQVREDEDQVQKVIEKTLIDYHPGLHTSLLKVALRVTVSQFFAPPARRLDHELGYDFVDAGLRLQAMANEGKLHKEEDVYARRVQVQGDRFHGKVPDSAIYVGRAAPGLKASPYANPHTLSSKGCRPCSGQVHHRDAGLDLYRDHLSEHPELVERAKRELKDRDLACWCKPEDACHVDVLLERIYWD